jgi:hypothetical protein
VTGGIVTVTAVRLKTKKAGGSAIVSSKPERCNRNRFFIRFSPPLVRPIRHLRRYIEMLFGVGTEQAKHLTDGDSK